MQMASNENLKNMIREFNVAMLVTRTGGGDLRARPMVVAGVDAENHVLLLTDRYSAKIVEISHDNHVNVTMQSSTKFVSVTGTASMIEDRAQVAPLWKESWKIWFPDGKDDPDLMLLKIQGTIGEYWDHSGTNGIRYLVEAGRAYFSGRRVDVSDQKLHDKVLL